MNLELDSAFGYNPKPNGGKIVCLGSGGIAYPQGSAVQLANLAGGPSQVWYPADGIHQITHCVLNPRGNLYVVAERRLSVNLLVFSASDRRMLQRLTDICKVSLRDCCFSRCGNYFATLAAGPTFQIQIFSVDASTNKFVRLTATTPTTVPGTNGFHSYTSISFNPKNPMELCTSGGGHAAFWKLARSSSGSATWTITHYEAKVTVQSVRLTAHAWATGGLTMVSNLAAASASGTFTSGATFGSGAMQSASGVLAPLSPLSQTQSGTALIGTMGGEVFEFDSSVRVGRLVLDLAGGEDASGLVTAPDESANKKGKSATGDAITAILITKHNVLLGTENGSVRICTHDPFVIKTIRLPITFSPIPRPKTANTTGVDSSEGALMPGLRSLCMTPEWNTIVCGSSDGSIVAIHLPGYEKPTVPELPTPKIAVVTASCTSANQCIVGGVHLPLATAGNATTVATVASDGLFRVFDYATNRELCREYLAGAAANVEPTTIAIGSGDSSHNTIGIGYSNGIVQFLSVSLSTDSNGLSLIKVKVVFHERVTKTLQNNSLAQGSGLGEGIQLLRFDPSGTMCVAVTDQRSLVFFALTGSSSAFDIKAIVNVVKMSTTGADGSLTQHSIHDIAWVPQGEAAVLVSLSNSDVAMLSVPTESDLSAYQASLFNALSPSDAPQVTESPATDAKKALGRTTSIVGTAAAPAGASAASAPAAAGPASLVIADLFLTHATPAEIPSSRVLINTWRLDIPCPRLIVGAFFDECIKVIGLGVDKETKIYSLNRTLPLDRKDRDTKLLRPDETFADHDKKANCIELARGGRTLITGGSDGRICSRDVSQSLAQAAPGGGATLPAAQAPRHVATLNGVIAIATSGDNLRLLSFGGDGLITVNTFGKQAPFPRGPYAPAVLSTSPPTAKAEPHPYFAEKRAAIQLELALLQHEAHRNAVKMAVSKLSARLANLRLENDTYDEDEKVASVDFLIPEERNKFQHRIDTAVEKLRDQVHWENLQRDYSIEKLQRECIDVMDTPLVEIRAMLTGPEAARVIASMDKKKKKDEPLPEIPPAANQTVYNAPFRKADPSQLLVLRKLKFLRLVEMRDRELRKVHELEDIRQPPVGDAGSPTGQQPAGSPGKDTAEKEEPVVEVTKLAQKGRKLEDEACDDVSHYLHHPWKLFTKQRAIVQVRLLEGKLFQLKSAFNKEFSALQRRKEDDVAKIEERNNRAKVIIKELDEQHLLFQPSISKSERSKQRFAVDDAEVPADKSTDPTEKRRREQLELERQRWLERHGDDGSSERALKVWMDGRLDKEIRVLEVKMDVPDFADEKSPKFVPLEERTEDQQKILREFEKKLQKRKEEVEARRKTLQTELEQIKKDNLETAKSFDEAVRKLFDRRLEVMRNCLEVELQQVKLVQCVVQFEFRRKLHKKLETQKVQLADELVVASKSAQAAKTKSDSLSDTLNQTQTNEKHKEKHMRQLPVFVDYEDQSELLYKLLMKRKPKKGKNTVDKRIEERKTKIRSEIHAEVQNSPDPFIFIEKEDELKRKITQAEESLPLPKIDRPNDCPDALWDAFQNFRQDRVDAEREIRRLSEEITKAQQEQSTAEEEEAEARQKAEDAMKQAADFQRDSVRAMYDVDEIHIFRQGLVEVEQAPVVTDYAGAILIDSSRIERLNSLIRHSGEEKVGLMKDIGEKRKELRMIDWDIDNLSYLMGTLEMEHSHLHTLRVTKQMQAFINGGGEDHNEKERKKLQEKIAHVCTTMAEKIEERKRAMLALRRANKEKELENRLLQEQVASAKEIVDERRSIYELQSSELEKERTSKLMRDMRVTRKLEDVAKAQQEEMVQLKREIDRLRERTFPSFAVVSKRIVGNPDELA